MHRQFYRELSELLFVVADMEGLMTRLEKNNLMATVKDLLFERGEQIPPEMRETASPVAAFNSFLDFIEDNFRFFDPQMRRAGSIVARELWFAYQETSKQEKRLAKELLNKFDH